MVVIDPPYITREVWELNALAIKKVIKAEDGKIILSTLDENEGFIKELTSCDKITFRPYIPTLIYQFAFYTNYQSPEFGQKNEEIPENVKPEEEEKRVLKILGLDFD